MKNMTAPSTAISTTTATFALSLLQAPAIPGAQAADTVAPLNETNLSPVESALVSGSAADAVKIIDSSALGHVRPEAVEKELPSVIEKILRELIQRGDIKDAQRVARIMTDFSPEATRQGMLRAFAALDKESFEKFNDQSVWHGSPTYRRLARELESPGKPHGISGSKTAEMVEVIEKAEVARNKTHVALEVGALCAVGVSKAAGARSHRNLSHRIVQTVGGLAALAGGATVFASLFGHTAGLVSWESALVFGSLCIATLGLEQVFKALRNSDED